MDGDGQKTKVILKAGSGNSKPDYRGIVITLIITFSLSMIFTVLSTGIIYGVYQFKREMIK